MKSGYIESIVLLLERVVVGEQLGRAIGVDRYKSIVRRFLGELVDETAGEDRSHRGTIQNRDLSENSWSGFVATIFGEKDWYARVAEV